MTDAGAGLSELEKVQQQLAFGETLQHALQMQIGNLPPVCSAALQPNQGGLPAGAAARQLPGDHDAQGDQHLPLQLLGPSPNAAGPLPSPFRRNGSHGAHMSLPTGLPKPVPGRLTAPSIAASRAASMPASCWPRSQQAALQCPETACGNVLPGNRPVPPHLHTSQASKRILFPEVPSLLQVLEPALRTASVRASTIPSQDRQLKQQVSVHPQEAGRHCPTARESCQLGRLAAAPAASHAASAQACQDQHLHPPNLPSSPMLDYALPDASAVSRPGNLESAWAEYTPLPACHPHEGEAAWLSEPGTAPQPQVYQVS